MELGLTFPLTRFIKMKTPAYGTEQNRHFCWDLHVIDLRGCKCLLAVHCYTRYTFVSCNVTPFQCQNLPALFQQGFFDSLIAAGFTSKELRQYLLKAGEIQITRTHGRRPVAFLNRAWEDVLALDLCLDPDRQAQPLLDHAVNHRPGRCAGEDGLGTGAERMERFLAGKFPFETQ